MSSGDKIILRQRDDANASEEANACIAKPPILTGR